MNIVKYLFLLLFFVPCAFVQGAELISIHAHQGVGHTRLVLNIKDRPGDWDVSYNSKLYKLSIVLPDTVNSNQNEIIYSGEGGVLKNVMLTPNARGLVVDIQAKEAVMHNLFTLSEPDRMVVDLFNNYEQKVTTMLNKSLSYTRWEKSSDMGRLKIYLGKIKKENGFKVISVENKKHLTSIYQETKVPFIVNGIQTIEEKAKFVPDQRWANFYYQSDRGYVIDEDNTNLLVQIGETQWEVDGINKSRNQDELIFYDRKNGKSTHTNRYGKEIVIKNDKVVRIDAGNTTIDAGEIVLSGHGKKAKALETIKMGDKVTIFRDMLINDQKFKEGFAYKGRLVLRNGMIVAGREEDFSTKLFVGTMENGDALVLLVEGQTFGSVGVSAFDGAKILLSLGVKNAVLLLSNGDSGFFINGKEINTHKEGGQESGKGFLFY